ncbi:hypothetical protein [Sphaerisporangium corydalis]|uniref:Glycosyltransferase RgtA/B/C/D-like domain-containing protein n=1 Tax=Sphaerisporangium corydalis TaxID=1441875 RepID=A0ABV9E7X0_9ACTN|nr:hypothetical protein [Sphaerisporangium corydalis]
MTVAGRRGTKPGTSAPPGRPVSRALRHPAAPLALAALLFGAAQLAFVGPGLRWGWDELVYLSQVNPGLPDAVFTAPRARGITWLAAPAALLSASPPVVRGWMTALSSAGLFLAYLPWLRVLTHRGAPAVVALAALLSGGLWVAQFYGGAVMPNLYVAHASVAATAFLLLALRGPSRGALAGLASSVAAVALLRPGDAAWLVLPLLLACFAARPVPREQPDPRVRREAAARVRPGAAAVLALAGGVAAGLAPWVAEAVTRYGGVHNRVREASELQGRLRPTWGVVHEFAALNGPLLCRPCAAGAVRPLLVMWWPALPVAAAAGLLAARPLGAARPYGLACAVGAGLSAQYLFLVGYGAPRFLLPAYLLLALPVALLLVRLASLGLLPAALAVAVAAGHLATQHVVLGHRVERSHAGRAAERDVAGTLTGSGLRGPCAVGGPAATLPIAYEAGCAFHRVRRRAGSSFGGVAYLTHAREPATAGWAERRLRTADGRVWYLWLPASR